MIRITINVDGQTAWIFKRIECLFHGHEWTEFRNIGMLSGAVDKTVTRQWIACERCKKEKR